MKKIIAWIKNLIKKLMIEIFDYNDNVNKQGVVCNQISTKQMTGNSGFANLKQPLLVACSEDNGSVSVDICAQADVPYGVYVPDSFNATGNKVKVQLLGTGTMDMVAGGTIKAGQLVFSSGSGEITATPNTGETYFQVGYARSNGSRGSLVKVDTSSPVKVTA